MTKLSGKIKLIKYGLVKMALDNCTKDFNGHLASQ